MVLGKTKQQHRMRAIIGGALALLVAVPVGLQTFGLNPLARAASVDPGNLPGDGRRSSFDDQAIHLKISLNARRTIPEDAQMSRALLDGERGARRRGEPAGLHPAKKG